MFLFRSTHAPPRRSAHRDIAPARDRSITTRRIVASLVAVMTIGGALAGAPGASTQAAPPAPNRPPTAKFTRTPDGAVVRGGTKMTLDASQSWDIDGDDITNYHWTIEGKYPNSYEGKVVTHQFQALPYTSRITLTVTDSAGGVSSTTQEVRVDGEPLSDPDSTFTPRTATIKVGDTIRFDGSQTCCKHSWKLLDLSGSVEGTGAVFEYKFRNPGNFDVEHTVVDQFGKASTSWGRVRVEDKPIASVIVGGLPEQSYYLAGDTVWFSGADSWSTTSNLDYAWSIDGQPVDPRLDPWTLKFTFKTPGTYEVALTVTDSTGRSDTSTVPVVILAERPALNATFRQNDASTVPINTMVTFDGSGSTGSDIGYSWKVSDTNGVVTTDPILHYKFVKQGTYTVELTVEDMFGKKSVKSTQMTVGEVPPPPSATFTQTPNTPTVAPNTGIKFDGSASTGSNLTYVWRVTGKRGVAGTDAVFDYEFPKAGSYNVELIVTDRAGQWNKKRINVQVADVNKAPTADFTQAPAVSTVTAGTEVSFNGSASSDPDGDKLTYSWTVRGYKGVFSTSSTMKYKFEKAGTYGVQLVVTDPSGATSKKWVKVTVTK